jgi:hypothetical protein
MLRHVPVLYLPKLENVEEKSWMVEEWVVGEE